MSERNFDKQAAPLARRLTNMLARGVVLLVNTASKMQALQISLLAGETADNLEHFEPYGYTSHPHPGAEAITVFVDGDRAHGITIVVADRRYRLRGLAAGEVALSDDLGQKVHLTRAGIVIDGANLPIAFNNTPLVTFNCSVAVQGASLTHAGKNVGSTHTHGGVQPGASNTGAPV